MKQLYNKNQITYLLGAGASSHAIPTIEGLDNRIKSLTNFLKNISENIRQNNIYSDTHPELFEHKDKLQEIIQELEWLILESEPHQTVDTLAKKFYIQEDVISLRKLKRALITYFYFEQNISFSNSNETENKHTLLLDKRYDNLIASIAFRNEEGIQFKDNIKIITWNYDLQIELALMNYLSKSNTSLNSLKNRNQIFPNKLLYTNANEPTINEEKFTVIKLNGNAFLDNYFDNNQQDSQTANDFRFQKPKPTNIEILKHFLNEYNITFSNGLNKNHLVYKYLNFSWEKSEEKYEKHQKVLKAAENIMKKTKVLIIVGYSFPYFNSEIDKRLFSNCIPDEIIIQDLNPEQIKERVLTLLNHNISNYEKKIKLDKPNKYFPIHPET